MPPGFEVQLVAAEPEIDKPMNLAFDARGRLWVTHSREYPIAATGAGCDRVSILEDTTGDGRADRITTFADSLNIPIGVAPMRDGAIVFGIPNVFRLYDRDGDGRADERRALYGPFDYDDTHGNPYYDLKLLCNDEDLAGVPKIMREHEGAPTGQ